MNRKQRKRRKMQLKKQGLEPFTPDYKRILTVNPLDFDIKFRKYFNGNEIKVGKLRGFEFTRPIKK